MGCLRLSRGSRSDPAPSTQHLPGRAEDSRATCGLNASSQAPSRVAEAAAAAGATGSATLNTDGLCQVLPDTLSSGGTWERMVSRSTPGLVSPHIPLWWRKEILTPNGTVKQQSWGVALLSPSLVSFEGKGSTNPQQNSFLQSPNFGLPEFPGLESQPDPQTA